MFKSFVAFRIAPTWVAPAVAELEALMRRMRFTPCAPTQEESVGWVPPRGEPHDPMLEVIGGQWIAKIKVERKSVPASAINIELELRCKAMEEQRGYAPGRKERKEMKEQIRLDLLPRAFSKQTTVLVWIDVANGLLVSGSSSPSAADLVVKEVLKLMSEAKNMIPLSTLRTQQSPATAMSDWLTSFDAPAGFTVDRDLELKAPNDEKSAVRYARHPLDIAEVAEHIRAGKVPTQLAMTWDSRVSFVLTDSFTVKNIQLLDDVFVDTEDTKSFDGDVLLTTGELSKMIPDLIYVLGGEMEPEDTSTATPAPAAE